MKTDEAYDYLACSWRSNRFAQAYILVGAVRGVGGDLTERVLRLVFCEMQDGPCGRCATCRHISYHTHPDVLWIEPQMRSRLISVEQMRAARRRIFQTSFAGGWKACVISAADRLGQEAANAFLKTLEEPPPKSVFFLLTDSPQFLLSTITSRCQNLILSGDEPRLAAKWEEDLTSVLMDRRTGGATGAFGRADQVDAILKKLKEAAEAEVQSESESTEDQTKAEREIIDARVNARFREHRTCLMRSLLFWQRDILLLATGADDTLVYFGEHKDILQRRADALTPAQALGNVHMVEEMNRQFEQNLPEKVVLGFGFSRLR